jgi:hypothetical protein
MKMGALEDYPLTCHRRPPTFCAYIRPSTNVVLSSCRVWFALPMKSSDCHSAFINAAESRDSGLSLMIYLTICGGTDLSGTATARISAVTGNEPHRFVDGLPNSGESIGGHDRQSRCNVVMLHSCWDFTVEA